MNIVNFCVFYFFICFRNQIHRFLMGHQFNKHVVTLLLYDFEGSFKLISQVHAIYGI